MKVLTNKNIATRKERFNHNSIRLALQLSLANHRCESNIGANRTQLAVGQPALSTLPRTGLSGANATNLPQRGFMDR
jgi:hypothetical protein